MVKPAGIDIEVAHLTLATDESAADHLAAIGREGFPVARGRGEGPPGAPPAPEGG